MYQQQTYTEQSPTLGAHTHGFWVGMGAMLLFMGWGVGMGAILLFMGGHGGHSFVHPCIQLQIGVKLLGCREYANLEVLRAEANDNE
jgi:hypothetical protein